MAPQQAKRPKPSHFQYNVVVIGGGSAGLVSAYIAAALKARVALVEESAMGGDCLNTGCVPSKALINITRLLARARRAEEFGLGKMTAEFDFAGVMAHVQKAIKDIAPHDSPERYRELGVDVIQGRGRLLSPWEVGVDSANGRQVLTTLAIIIATGAKPLVPSIPGLPDLEYLTSDNIWKLRQLPARLLVLGGGPIGCELAQCFARLGSKVSMVEMAPRLLMKEDEEVSALILQQFSQEGIEVLLNHKAERIDCNQPNKQLIASHDGKEVRVAFDAVLLALGRKPTIDGYGLAELGVKLAEKGTIAVDGFQATNYPTIFACGDIAGPYQFTHTASHQAWYAAVNALFGHIYKMRTDYSVIPWATFTEPEIARVGLREGEAQEQKIAYEISKYELCGLDRAITDNAAKGFVKVLTKAGSDKILGVTIAGEQAGELVAEFVLAMKYNIGLKKILGTIHVYPTWAEANKYAAGVWRKNHQPQFLLNLLAKYHQWRRR